MPVHRRAEDRNGAGCSPRVGTHGPPEVMGYREGLRGVRVLPHARLCSAHTWFLGEPWNHLPWLAENSRARLALCVCRGTGASARPGHGQSEGAALSRRPPRWPRLVLRPLRLPGSSGSPPSLPHPTRAWGPRPLPASPGLPAPALSPTRVP